MASSPIRRPGTPLTLSSCLPTTKLFSVNSLSLSSKGLDWFLFIGFLFNHSASLLSKASNSLSLLLQLFQKHFAVIDTLVMDIGPGCAN
jgi:hypothetical protein